MRTPRGRARLGSGTSVPMLRVTMRRMTWTRKSSPSSRRTYKGRHRLEHWYRDNQVYFITARCRDRFPAFASEDAKAVFWDRFTHYARVHGYTPWVTSLLDNHDHTLGYLRVGDQLKDMMRKLHGSVAKLVNDQLAFEARALECPCSAPLNAQGRLVPFFTDTRDHDYYDGCIRDEKQARLAYRYVLTQARRHGVAEDYRQYPHTRVNVELEPAIKRSLQLSAFLRGVAYRRYARHGH